MTLDTIVYSETIISIGLGALLGAAISAVIYMLKRQKLLSSHTTLEVRLSQYQDMASALEQDNKTLSHDLQNLKENLVRKESENKYFLQQIEQGKADLKKTEEALIGKFENLSNKIFEEKTEKFKLQSRESLGELLNPLKEKIGDFEKKITDSFGSQAKEHFSLKEQIKNIVETNEKMTLQAEGLANALKGESKTQGDWGEIILEKILEDSGLRKNQDYTLQGSGLGLKHPETGKTQKPDVVVNLPENKHIIIDSKVSLTHYERFFSETEETLRYSHLKQFINSVRKHVEDLEQRRYQDTDQLGTPDFVLMFMPIEGAYLLALQEDPDLHRYAWNKNVVLVCHSTLFATLRTISSLWRLELQNRNALEIAKQSGALYDKIAGFFEDMEKLGKMLKNAEGSYDSAMNKLSIGKGNILGRTEKLKRLGAKASKSLPATQSDTDKALINMHTEEETPDQSDQDEAA